jgi:hypothetical protein
MANKRNFEILSENNVPDINQKAVESFSKGIEQKNDVLPWKSLDPKAKPIYGVNLRLNEYELSLLRYVSDAEDRSQQKVLKKLLVPALEEATRKLSSR